MLSVYGAGKTNGVAVELGAQISHIVPVIEGQALPHGITRFYMAGIDLDNLMIKKLSEKYQDVDRQEAVKVKEEVCYIAQDF